MNRLKTVILLAVLTALLMWAGQVLGGAVGLWFALGVATLMNIGAYWFSDKIVLRMYRAQEVSPVQAPELYLPSRSSSRALCRAASHVRQSAHSAPRWVASTRHGLFGGDIQKTDFSGRRTTAFPSVRRDLRM